MTVISSTQGKRDPDRVARERRKMILFLLPLVIQAILTFPHLANALKLNPLSPGIYQAFIVATFVYSAFMLLMGVLSAASMTLEGINSNVKRGKDVDKAWMVDRFKTIKKYIPAYNGSFGPTRRKIIGAISTVIYVTALALNLFFGNAVSVLFSAVLVWFGIRMVAECHRLIRDAEKAKQQRAAKKAQEMDDLGL